MRKILVLLLSFSLITGCAQQKTTLRKPDKVLTAENPDDLVKFKNSEKGLSQEKEFSDTHEAKESGKVIQPVPVPVQVKDVRQDKQDVKVTLNFRSMRLEDILKAVSKQTGINFITSPDLRDIEFEAYLKDVTIKEALDALLSSHGLTYEQFPKSDIFVVKKRSDSKVRVGTRIFKLKYLQLAGTESSSVPSAASGGKEQGAAVQAPGKQSGEQKTSIIEILNGALSENGGLQVDPYTNSIIVTDLPEKFPQIADLIEQLDVLIPQIYIEVEIVELNTDDVRKLGTDFGLSDGTLAKLVGPARVIQWPMEANGNNVLPSASDLATKATISPVGDYGSLNAVGSHLGIMSFQEFRMVIRAIETSGIGKFLSKPKIMTLNNKQATIKVTANTAVGITATTISQTGSILQTAERVTTGVSLKVTPQVNDNAFITMLLEPSISRPKSSSFFPGQFVDAQDTTMNTSVRVKDGETILIGGLLSTEESKTLRSVPLLGKIPIIGNLFSSSDRSRQKKELMIFITPRIVTQ